MALAEAESVSSAQVEMFRRDGYLVVPGMMPAPTLDELRAQTDALLADPTQRRASAADYLRDQYATVWGVFSEHLWLDEDRLGAAVRFVRDNPRAYAVASALLGEPARAAKVSMQLMYPRCGCRQPWHQDHTPNDPDLWWINCMYYLEPMTAENGSLLVVPGSHRVALDRRVPDYGPIPGSVRLVPPPGAAVFFMGQIMHAVDEHRGMQVRRGVKTHYSVARIDPFGKKHEQRYSRGVRRGDHLPVTTIDDGVHSYLFPG